jgi:eukaryotic-like serine/threonine-protein kinase
VPLDFSPAERHRRQPLADSTARIVAPAACGADYVVFSWAFRGGINTANIWRANSHGSGAVKLTNGRSDWGKVCSPDQKWVYYGRGETWRVPLDGSGKPEVGQGGTLPDEFVPTYAPVSMSPDGQTLSYVVTSQNTGRQKVALLDLKSLSSPRLLDLSPQATGEARFTPDGKAVACTVRENEVDNLWVQPLDGSAGRSITNFHSDQIEEFHWSPDGKKLGILRSKSESDVVLLQESKP